MKRLKKILKWTGIVLGTLLVVMLILGLLAAIAIPAFFDQRTKADDASAKAGARTAQMAAEAYSTDKSGRYGGLSTTALMAIEPTLTDLGDRLAVETTEGGLGYEVEVAAVKTGSVFRITRKATGLLEFSCDALGEAGCPATGNWGGLQSSAQEE